MQYLTLLSFISFFIISCQQGISLGPSEGDSLATASQESCGFVQNSYGARVSWKSNLPINIKIANDYPSEYKDALSAAAKVWEDAAGMTLFNITTSNEASSSTIKNNSNLVSWNTTWDESRNSMQAITSLYWTGNQITEADLAIDAKYYTFYISTPTESSQLHLESLLLHELGHVLGLKHRNTMPTVMWPTLNGSTIRTTLDTSDIQSLKCEY